MTKWITVEEYRQKEGLNSRQTANNHIKRKNLETKKEARVMLVEQIQTVTLVKVEE